MSFGAGPMSEKSSAIIFRTSFKSFPFSPLTMATDVGTSFPPSQNF
jgi:hypothetical protein